jgi:hypothetical protein
MGLWIIPALLVIFLAFALEKAARGTDRASAESALPALPTLPPSDF